MSESQVQRAELLADLGRYDEAAAELATADRADVAAQTLLARVKLAAGAPREALAAADAAVAAGPTDLAALIARGMVLADLGHTDEAAVQAEQILRQGTGSGYACTSAAAILAEVRNGQVALDAAWEGVRLTPDQPRAHLVLGVVAAGLGLADVATRAYQEALALDPRLPVVQTALGVARLEQHRYAQALSHLAEESTPRAGADGPAAESPDADRPPPGSTARPRPAGPAVGRAAAPPPERPAGSVHRLARTLTWAAGFALLAPLLVAWAHAVGVGAVPMAVLLAGLGLVAGLTAWARLPGRMRAQLRREPAAAVAAGGVVPAPVLLAAYVATEVPWLLLIAAAGGLVSLFVARRVRA